MDIVDEIETWADMHKEDRCCGEAERESHDATVKEVLEEIHRLYKQDSIVKAIEAVTQDEASSVTIYAANPEFGHMPDYMVDIQGTYSNFMPCSCMGDSVLEALERAVESKKKIDEQEKT